MKLNRYKTRIKTEGRTNKQNKLHHGRHTVISTDSTNHRNEASHEALAISVKTVTIYPTDFY